VSDDDNEGLARCSSGKLILHLYFPIIPRYNKTSVADGVAAVLNGNLDSFIYDGTVLDYLVAQDEDSGRLLNLDLAGGAGGGGGGACASIRFRVTNYELRLSLLTSHTCLW